MGDLKVHFMDHLIKQEPHEITQEVFYPSLSDGEVENRKFSLFNITYRIKVKLKVKPIYLGSKIFAFYSSALMLCHPKYFGNYSLLSFSSPTPLSSSSCPFSYLTPFPILFLPLPFISPLPSPALFYILLLQIHNLTDVG